MCSATSSSSRTWSGEVGLERRAEQLAEHGEVEGGVAAAAARARARAPPATARPARQSAARSPPRRRRASRPAASVRGRDRESRRGRGRRAGSRRRYSRDRSCRAPPGARRRSLPRRTGRSRSRRGRTRGRRRPDRWQYSTKAAARSASVPAKWLWARKHCGWKTISSCGYSAAAIARTRSAASSLKRELGATTPIRELGATTPIRFANCHALCLKCAPLPNRAARWTRPNPISSAASAAAACCRWRSIVQGRGAEVAGSDRTLDQGRLARQVRVPASARHRAPSPGRQRPDRRRPDPRHLGRDRGERARRRQGEGRSARSG